MAEKIWNRIDKLLSVKSIITLTLTAFLGCLLCGIWHPDDEIRTLYCTAYGMIMTYFFTKKEE